MDSWPLWVGVVVALYFVLVFRGRPSIPAAIAQLQAGALLVDVRSPAEFSQGHVAGAVNVPLSDLPQAMEGVAPDRSRVLLVHCLSGGRSALAAAKLRRAGYSQVFNVGSLGRARRLAARAGLKDPARV